MGRLVYSAIVSLDGMVADASGDFGWAEPDEAVHRYANELERPIGTYLYGRRMYEVMAVWETLGDEPGSPEYVREYADIWRAADKVVYSTTLDAPSTPRTRVERAFDPEAVRALKRDAAADLSIGGPTLAGQALAAGLVDECVLLITPVLVGDGLRALPEGVRRDLELLGERSFPNGVVSLRFGVRNA